jgi:hypothetical protein
MNKRTDKKRGILLALACVLCIIIMWVIITPTSITTEDADDLVTLRQQPTTSFVPPNTSLVKQEEANQSKFNHALLKDGNYESSITRTFKLAGGTSKDQVIESIVARMRSDGWQSKESMPNNVTGDGNIRFYTFTKDIQIDASKKNLSLFIEQYPQKSDEILFTFTIY